MPIPKKRLSQKLTVFRSRGQRPTLHLAEGDGHRQPHIQGEAIDFARPTTAFGIEEFEFNIPTVTVNPAEGAFFLFNGVEFTTFGDRCSKDGSCLEYIGGGEVEGPISGGFADVTQIVVDSSEILVDRMPNIAVS